MTRFEEGDFPALVTMRAISLEEMSSVSLMNRTDTKFLTKADTLALILRDAGDAGYRVCCINGERLMSYRSVYYDTPDLCMFTAHRNRKLVRQKVRVRRYVVSDDTFLEIKRKNNHRRTKKKRLAIPSGCIGDFSKASGASEFLESRTVWKAADLSPETSTDFERITLVDGGMTERVTIDINLEFENFRSGKTADLGPLVIIELKQDGTRHSVFRDILLKHRVFPYRVSKYCVAVTLTDPQARYGRFKEKIRHIEKMIEGKLL